MYVTQCHRSKRCGNVDFELTPISLCTSRLVRKVKIEPILCQLERKYCNRVLLRIHFTYLNSKCTSTLNNVPTPTTFRQYSCFSLVSTVCLYIILHPPKMIITTVDMPHPTSATVLLIAPMLLLLASVVASISEATFSDLPGRYTLEVNKAGRNGDKGQLLKQPT